MRGISERQGISLVKDGMSIQVLCDHELSKVSNSLGGRCDLWNISQDDVGFGVLGLNLRPLLGRT
jgi:hypothetical protein